MGDETEYQDAERVPDTQHRNFSQAIAAMENGDLNKELTAKSKEVLAELFSQVGNGQKTVKGNMTVVFNFVVSDDGMVDIVADVKSKTPKLPRRRSVMFTDADGNMHVRNPAQTDMFNTDGSLKRVRTA
ncbi:hypothetical protein [Pyruvatibacter sp.]